MEWRIRIVAVLFLAVLFLARRVRLFVVALRLERALDVRVNRPHVQASRARVDVRKLPPGEREVHVPIRQEVHVAAVRVERGRVAGDHRVGQGLGLCGLQRVDPDHPHTSLARLRVGDPPAVRGPCVRGDVVGLAAIHIDDATALHLDVPKALLLVAEGQLLAVRRPDRSEAPDIAVRRYPTFLSRAVPAPYVQLVLARGITEVGDPATVR